MTKHYTFEEDARPYFHPYTPWGQQQLLPNLEEITDPAEALFEIAVTNALEGAPHDLAFNQPGRPWSAYCTVFLRGTPMGSSKSWDGSGVLLEMHNSTKPRVYRFALCKHEKTEEGHKPNHGRGWHPGHCKHCGMDMTVDSGD
jgi:hypothetical protein